MPNSGRPKMGPGLNLGQTVRSTLQKLQQVEPRTALACALKYDARESDSYRALHFREVGMN